MSNNYWDEEDDDQDTDTDVQMDGTDLLKKLRKAKRSDEKRIKELTDKLDEYSKAQNESIIKKVLEKNGVTPKAARLILKELEGDISEDSVLNYLEDNAEVFGLEIQYQDEPEETSNRAALGRQDAITQGAITPDRVENLESKIANAQSADEIISMIYNS